jgi:RNA polymerase sigma-70 factor (ECF subfamily)
VRTDGIGISAEVVEACRRGERDALRVLYETYKDHVYSIALYHFHGDAAMAADVTQQVFVKALTNIGRFRGDADVASWLYRLTVNACLDHRRSGAAREIASDPETFSRLDGSRVDGRPSPEQSASQAEISQRVQAAVSSLPEKLRLPVLPRYFEDLSYDELGAALDCSPGTAASRLHKGHQLLREKLMKWGIR